MRPRLLCLVSSLWMSLVLPSGTGAATDTDSQDGWGTVIAYVTEDGIPRCFANVVIDGTLWKGLTDETGICTITYLPGGKYTIHCLLMGFGEIRKPVTIIAGQTVQVSFEVQRRGDFHDDRYFEDLGNCGPVSHLASKQATSSHGTGPSGLRRSESVLLTIPFEADTIRAIVTKVHDDVAPRWDSTATEIRFEDRRGDVLYRESVYAWDEWSDVLEEEITLSASVLHGDYGEVIELHNDPAPSTVRDPGSSRYFLLRTTSDGTGPRTVILPVSRWDQVFPERDGFALYMSEGWFRAGLPLVPRFQTPEGGFEPSPEWEDGLAVLDTSAYLNPDYLAPGAIRLYEAPTGNAHQSFVIENPSGIVVGRGRFRITGACIACLDQEDAWVELVRLEVTIDGRHGFLEEEDFSRIGMVLTD